MEELKTLIRDVPDFPKPGIVFKDITPILANGKALKKTIDWFTSSIEDLKPDVIIGIEARGFLFGVPVATNLGLGFCPVRKAGKLPFNTLTQGYELEYGEAQLQIHSDAFEKGSRIVVVDDLLATGGTAAATSELVKKLGGIICANIFLIELMDLKGREKLKSKIITGIQY